MHYLIYEVKNDINGKIYIGKHKTNDINDDYMGSGKILKRSIEKYGIENFTKTILFELETEQEMNDKEAEIVNEEFIRCGSNYNLMVGGQGGWDYINDKCKPRRGFTDDDRLNAIKAKEILRKNDEWNKNYREKQSLGMNLFHKNNPFASSEANKKYCWIKNVDLSINKKILKSELDKFLYENREWTKGKIVRKVTCEFCGIEFGNNNIKQHRKKCSKRYNKEVIKI